MLNLQKKVTQKRVRAGWYEISVDGKVIGRLIKTKNYWNGEYTENGKWHTAHGVCKTTKKEAIIELLSVTKFKELW
jgi:hypothetical protein